MISSIQTFTWIVLTRANVAEAKSKNTENEKRGQFTSKISNFPFNVEICCKFTMPSSSSKLFSLLKFFSYWRVSPRGCDTVNGRVSVTLSPCCRTFWFFVSVDSEDCAPCPFECSCVRYVQLTLAGCAPGCFLSPLCEILTQYSNWNNRHWPCVQSKVHLSLPHFGKKCGRLDFNQPHGLMSWWLAVFHFIHM